jgi:hypothetical protein
MSEDTRGIESWPTERAHHPFSPSSLQNREACACYTGRESKHARTIAGTLAHGMVETRIDNSDLTDEDSLAAAGCIDMVDKYLMAMERERDLVVHQRFQEISEHSDAPEEECLRNRDTASEQVPAILHFTEIELAVDECEFPDAKSTTSGFLDTLLIDHTEQYAEMLDWKFGMWPVEPAQNNLQCISYALGGFRHFPKLQKIRFIFWQPLIDLRSEAIFTRAEIPALYLRVQVVVARAREAQARYLAGDWSMATPFVPACNFCGNIGKCPKVLEKMCVVGSKFYPLEIPENITPTMVVATEDTSLGLRLAQVVKVWADAFRAQTTNRVLEGRAELPPGYSIQSQSRRELVDKDAFKRVALTYLTEFEYLSTLDVLFGAVEKAIQDKAPRGQKKMTVQSFQAELETAGATKRGQPFSFLRAKSANTPTEEKTNA